MIALHNPDNQTFSRYVDLDDAIEIVRKIVVRSDNKNFNKAVKRILVDMANEDGMIPKYKGG